MQKNCRDDTTEKLFTLLLTQKEEKLVIITFKGGNSLLS